MTGCHDVIFVDDGRLIYIHIIFVLLINDFSRISRYEIENMFFDN